MAVASQGASALARDPSSAGGLWPLIAAGLIVFGAACGYAIAFGEIAAFAITLALVAAIAVLFDYRIGALLLVLFLGLGATSFMPRGVMGIPALNPWNILIVATLVSYALRGKLAALAPPPLVWLVVVPILIAGLLGLPNVQDIHPSFFEAEHPLFVTELGYYRELVVRPLLIPLMAVLVGVAVTRSQKPEGYLTALLVSVWIIAAIQLYFIIAADVPHLSVLANPYLRGFYDELGVHANDLGRIFAVAYALILFSWWEARNPKYKAAAFITLGVAALALVLTFSRAGLLAFFLINGLFLLWKFSARTVALAIVAGGISLALAPQYVWNRITFGWSADANTVSANRIEEIWAPMMPELATSPVWGNGIGAVMWSEPMLNGSMMAVSHPHNAYLEAFYDMGIIGLVLLLAYYWHVWKGFRSLGSNAYLSGELRGFFQGATAALLVFLATGMAGSSLRPDSEFVYLWLAIGMMYGMLARRPAS
jgi:O-antigen ligase